MLLRLTQSFRRRLPRKTTQKIVHPRQTQMSAIRRNPDCTISSSCSFKSKPFHATKSSPKTRPFICGGVTSAATPVRILSLCHSGRSPPHGATHWRNSSFSAFMFHLCRNVVRKTIPACRRLLSTGLFGFTGITSPVDMVLFAEVFTWTV